MYYLIINKKGIKNDRYNNNNSINYNDNYNV